MRHTDWIFVFHWAPILGVAFLLGIGALVVRALTRGRGRVDGP